MDYVRVSVIIPIEGTPMSALEAIAFGIPTISTPVDGLVEIIQEGITGYLFKDDDV